MADRKMKPSSYSVRNIAPGMRGFFDARDGFLQLDAGASATGVRFHESEYESAVASKYFEIAAGDSLPDQDDGDDRDAPAGAKAYNDITVADIKAHLDGQTPPVAYETDANKKALYEQYAATFAKAGTNPTEGTNTAPAGDTLDKMSDDDLRDTVKALTGEEPAADADRDTLLKLARGEA